MADDGSWAGGSDSGAQAPGDERARLALRGVLRDLERRLSAGAPAGLRPETAAALIQTLDALGRRMAQHEAAAAGRAGDLATALQALSRHLDLQAQAQATRDADLSSRLDLLVSELAQVRASQAAPRPDPGPIRVILAGASAAAALSVVAAGVVAVSQPQMLPRFIATPLAAIIDLPLRPSLAPAQVAPVATRTVAPLPTIAPKPGDTLAAVLAALKAGDATALPRLTGLAQAGDARAQLQLAALYESGQAGLARDLDSARLWTRRAAEGGDRVAMHNLGLFLSEGEGGGRDLDEAAIWFRRAADRGVVDSQYNLGLLYEAGRGVGRNLREAYRWYAIAANAGDTTAREKQVDLEARLKPAERADLDREASGFRPGAAASTGPVVVIPPAATVAETQALLARQGYYLGPIDGAASPALTAAAAAYLRDHPGAAPTS